jgi:hypothetical protein
MPPRRVGIAEPPIIGRPDHLASFLDLGRNDFLNSVFALDWPHFDFDLPFLSEQAKQNILGLNATPLFR